MNPAQPSLWHRLRKLQTSDLARGLYTLFFFHRRLALRRRARRDRIDSMLMLGLNKGIGDLLIACYGLRGWKARHPRTRVTLVTYPQYESLARANPDIDEVLVYDNHRDDAPRERIETFVRAARRRRYDVLVDLMLDDKYGTARLARRMRARGRVSWSTRTQGVTSDLRGRGWPVANVTTATAALFTLLDPQAAPARPTFDFGPAAAAEVDTLLAACGCGPRPVLLAPGARDSLAVLERRWPIERYVEVARRLDGAGHGPVLVNGSPAEAAYLEPFAALGDRAVPLAGRLSIPGLFELVRRAALVVCNNSAPLHVAALHGTPTVCFSFDIQVPFTPPAPFNASIVFFTDPEDLSRIPLETVWAAARERIAAR